MSKKVPKKFQKKFQKSSKKFQKSSKKIPKKFQKSSKKVPKKFQKSSKKVLKKFEKVTKKFGGLPSFYQSQSPVVEVCTIVNHKYFTSVCSKPTSECEKEMCHISTFGRRKKQFRRRVKFSIISYKYLFLFFQYNQMLFINL